MQAFNIDNNNSNNVSPRLASLYRKFHRYHDLIRARFVSLANYSLELMLIPLIMAFMFLSGFTIAGNFYASLLTLMIMIFTEVLVLAYGELARPLVNFSFSLEERFFRSDHLALRRAIVVDDLKYYLELINSASVASPIANNSADLEAQQNECFNDDNLEARKVVHDELVKAIQPRDITFLLQVQSLHLYNEFLAGTRVARLPADIKRKTYNFLTAEHLSDLFFGIYANSHPLRRLLPTCALHANVTTVTGYKRIATEVAQQYDRHRELFTAKDRLCRVDLNARQRAFCKTMLTHYEQVGNTSWDATFYKRFTHYLPEATDMDLADLVDKGIISAHRQSDNKRLYQLKTR